jgi:DNA-binding protein Fis
MKNKISKKEIRGKISDSVNQAISQLEGKDPSKKVKKIIKRASRKIANKVSRQLRDAAPKAKKITVAKGSKVNGKKKELEVVA